MRSFYLVAGLATAAPQIVFLLIHKFGIPWFHGIEWKPRRPWLQWAQRANKEHRRWLLATSLRLAALGQAFNGIRMFGVNAVNITNPVVYTSWMDATFAVVCTALTAIASALSVIVFLRYRDWSVDK